MDIPPSYHVCVVWVGVLSMFVRVHYSSSVLYLCWGYVFVRMFGVFRGNFLYISGLIFFFLCVLHFFFVVVFACHSFFNIYHV